jgi:phosphate transport system permease protein
MEQEIRTTPQGAGAYPEGRDFDSFVKRRKGVGRVWQWLFFGATFVGIIALVALLADITNKAFGYVAIQNRIDPEVLVVTYHKEQVLAAPRTLASEDDESLATNVAARDGAIGFFGYAFYDNHADELRLVTVDGVAPSAETVDSGEYKYARPLFVYSTQQAIERKPQLAAFLAHYLANANEVVDGVGYFPLQDETLQEQVQTWETATGQSLAEFAPATDLEGDIVTTGSSTVAPITQRIADDFKAALGFGGEIAVESTGTDAGFRTLCVDQGADIANASRQMVNLDYSACAQKRLNPVEFRIANDGIAMVVSEKNTFIDELTTEQIQQIFTTAERWSDIDPAWPDKPILHYIPGADSGTLDFFVATTFGTELAEQPNEVLAAILAANISAGRYRALDSQKPVAERTTEELVQLIQTEVVRPSIAKTWTLWDSLFNREKVEAEAAMIPGSVELSFRSWVSWEFITGSQSSDPMKAGISTAIWGSLWVTLIAFLVAIPLGVAAAIYLEEYNTGRSRVDQLIETNINNLAGVPSIIYGMLGLAVFVRFLGPITSGLAFGYGDPATANGRTILSAGMTLGLLILPLVIINAREAIRAVPRAMREGAYGLGATRWQTTWYHVLPSALPGILTGVILAVSRAFGETAPLLVVGVSTFIVVNPSNVFSKFTTLPAQIYQWTSRPQQEFQNLAAAAIIVLLVLLIALNTAAILLRNRYSRRV